MFSKRNLFRLRHWIKANPIFAILLFMVPFILVFTLIRFKNNISFPTLTQGLKKVKNIGKNEGKFVNSADIAFNFIFQKCPNSDEIRPKTSECVNTSGFSSSIIESLEALYLLDLKEDFEKAKQYVFEHFNCNEFEWVNTHDFWSRGIGSLIGAYLVTGDKQFLNLASTCAHTALEISPISDPYDFINFKEKQGKNKEWKNGTFAGDLFAGVPEIIAISYLSNDLDLLANVENIDTITSQLTYGNLPIFYDLANRRAISTTTDFDGNQVNLLHQLAVIYSLKEYSELGFSIQQILKRFHNPGKNSWEMYYPLLDVAYIMENLSEPIDHPLIENITLHAKEQLINGKRDGLRISTNPKNFHFNYESVGLRNLIQKAIKDKDTQTLENAKLSFITPLSHTQVMKGFVGISSSRKNIPQKGTLMPSNLFGQWFNTGALFYSHNYDILENGIFNDRGHLIMCNLIHPFSRESVQT